MNQYKFNGILPIRTFSSNNTLQSFNKDKKNLFLQPDKIQHGNQVQGNLFKAQKAQPKFGMNSNYSEEANKEISDLAAELAVMRRQVSVEQATQKVDKVIKKHGWAALAEWCGKRINWVLENLSKFVGVIKSFLKGKWNELMDKLFQ